MDGAATLALYDREMRRDARVDAPGFRIEREDGIVRLVGPGPGPQDNCILYSRLTAGTADAAIRRQVESFRSLGHAFEWKLHGHDGPSDLTSRLVAHGFTSEPHETLVALDLADSRPPLRHSPGYDIRLLDDPDRLQDLASVQDRVWSESHDGFVKRLGEEMRRTPAALAVYVSYHDDRPVATAWLRIHDGTAFASLWGGATLAEHRGRGVYRELVAIRAERAREAGARFLLVDARDSSRPILERLGFQPLTTLSAFAWRPSDG